MVVKHSERRSDDGLAVAHRIPRDCETWRPVVLVARESLLHSHRILRRGYVGSREVNSRQRVAERLRGNLFRDLVVVTDAVVERQVRPDFPRILREESDWFVADAADRIAKPLNEIRREPESILLHRGEIRSSGKCGI